MNLAPVNTTAKQLTLKDRYIVNFNSLEVKIYQGELLSYLQIGSMAGPVNALECIWGFNTRH